MAKESIFEKDIQDARYTPKPADAVVDTSFEDFSKSGALREFVTAEREIDFSEFLDYVNKGEESLRQDELEIRRQEQQNRQREYVRANEIIAPEKEKRLSPEEMKTIEDEILASKEAIKSHRNRAGEFRTRVRALEKHFISLYPKSRQTILDIGKTENAEEIAKETSERVATQRKEEQQARVKAGFPEDIDPFGTAYTAYVRQEREMTAEKERVALQTAHYNLAIAQRTHAQNSAEDAMEVLVPLHMGKLSESMLGLLNSDNPQVSQDVANRIQRGMSDRIAFSGLMRGVLKQAGVPMTSLGPSEKVIDAWFDRYKKVYDSVQGNPKKFLEYLMEDRELALYGDYPEATKISLGTLALIRRSGGDEMVTKTYSMSPLAFTLQQGLRGMKPRDIPGYDPDRTLKGAELSIKSGVTSGLPTKDNIKIWKNQTNPGKIIPKSVIETEQANFLSRLSSALIDPINFERSLRTGHAVLYQVFESFRKNPDNWVDTPVHTMLLTFGDKQISDKFKSAGGQEGKRKFISEFTSTTVKAIQSSIENESRNIQDRISGGEIKMSGGQYYDFDLPAGVEAFKLDYKDGSVSFDYNERAFKDKAKKLFPSDVKAQEEYTTRVQSLMETVFPLQRRNLLNNRLRDHISNLSIVQEKPVKDVIDTLFKRK